MRAPASPSRGTRRSTAWKSELRVLRLQHGDFFAHLSIAAPLVPRVGFAAHEELRYLAICCSFELHPSLGCVRDLVVATDLSVEYQRIQYLGSSLRQLLYVNNLKKMISSSFQSYRGYSSVGQACSAK